MLMQVSVTFRKIDASDTLRNYAHEKLYRIKKYVDDPIEAHVVLSVETGDMYSAIDMVVDKVEAQIKKYREKLKKRKSDGGTKPLVMKMNILAGESFEEDRGPEVIKTKQINAKPMDIEEAVMQMDLANSEFLVFTNARTRDINVIYRRRDGNYGLIEPENR
jgi:putative sigma-54 modulation protein